MYKKGRRQKKERKSPPENSNKGYQRASTTKKV